VSGFIAILGLFDALARARFVREIGAVYTPASLARQAVVAVVPDVASGALLAHCLAKKAAPVRGRRHYGA
jgi:hypothetical protein